MNLKTEIQVEIQAGKVKSPFRAEDLLLKQEENGDYLIGNRTYKLSSIITNLNNMSVGPGERKGNHVRNGRDPWFSKNEDGQFTILE